MKPLDPDQFAVFVGGAGTAIADEIRKAYNVPAQADLPPVVASEGALAPPSWDDYVGQEKAKLELQIRVQSAIARGVPIPHVLLLAGPGSGKTTLVRLMAAEAEQRLVVMNRPPKNNDALLDTLTPILGGGILFVDECHNWGPTAQGALMQLTEDGQLDTSSGPVDVSRITLVGATTDPQKLLAPLRTRFACKPRFEAYSDGEMGQIVAGMLERSDVELDDDVVAALGAAAGGNPRAARDLAEAARDLAVTGMPTTAEAILSFAGIYEDGLSREHVRYLEAISQCKHGVAGLERMATLLDIATGEVRVLERTLAARGLIMYSGSAGRQISPAGRGRLTSAKAA